MLAQDRSIGTLLACVEPNRNSDGNYVQWKEGIRVPL